MSGPVEKGDLEISRYEARVRFRTQAELPPWSGNTLRSGFGAQLRNMVCIAPRDDCPGCPHRDLCAYDYFYNSRPPEGARVLRKQEDIPRPFAIEPPRPGIYRAGEGAIFGFTLFGRGISYLPYFLLALRNLGEAGMSLGFREGLGRYDLEAVESLGSLGTSSPASFTASSPASFPASSPGCQAEGGISGDALKPGVATSITANIYSGGTVYNRSIIQRYSDLLHAAQAHRGRVTISFITPAQIKENGVFTSAPSFRGLVSKLLFRANVLAEFYGKGMIYDNQEALRILGECRPVQLAEARTGEVSFKRRFHGQGGEKVNLPPFFLGDLVYEGEITRDVFALLQLGRLIHVGKAATFGNGVYEVRIEEK